MPEWKDCEICGAPLGPPKFVNHRIREEISNPSPRDREVIFREMWFGPRVLDEVKNQGCRYVATNPMVLSFGREQPVWKCDRVHDKNTYNRPDLKSF